MEREIEVKLLGLDIENFKSILKDIGAEKFLEEEQVNITINSSRHEISSSVGYLRIRETSNLLTGEEKRYITFKEQIADKKVRDNIEHTTEISSVLEMRNILRLMGYDLQDLGTKKRTSYKYKNVRFDIDIWDEKTYPYPYVEVEAKSEAELYDILENIGIEKKHISTKSIAELKEDLFKTKIINK